MSQARQVAWTSWLVGLVLLVGLAVQIITRPTSAVGLLRITVLNVGQGDAILIDTPDGQHFLIDAGPGDAILSALDDTLAPPEELALVVATHNDADHIGGLPDVLHRYPVEEAWISGAIHTTETYQSWLRSLQEHEVEVTVVSSGHTRSFGDVDLSVLHPPRPMVGERPAENHDATVVVRLEYGVFRALLTGDLEATHEDWLIDHHPTEMPVQFLKVTHHGSRYGSSERFLRYVQPEVAVISAGAENRYGHPHPDTLARLTTAGVEVLRTDERGHLTFLTNGIEFWQVSEVGKRLLPSWN